MVGNQNNGRAAHPPQPNAGLTAPLSAPDAAAIQAWLVENLSAELRIASSEIDVAEPFASYGLGSTEMVSLSGQLADWLGRPLPAELAYECPTIELLARRLAQPQDLPHPASPSAPDGKRADEPIAIIGIGCRFPDADGTEAFWQLLHDGREAIREVPPQRFNLNDYFDADPDAPGKMNTRWGGFLEQVDQFDPSFFGISPREAERMDPQQRLLLEVAAQALEDAGQTRDQLAGSSTGVFIGISNNDYGRLQLGDFKRIDAYAGTGNALSIAANRISYVFDLHGPSMALDTACSSSLVAVHEACASLRSGESTLALAGGVNLILSPAITINFSKAGAMAPDGRCKTFDARANGYVRGEGAGVVVLKPLRAAMVDDDQIYAVILGSAINQDGRSNGLMAPNPQAQEAVLHAAYRRAGVAPAEVAYVEAHGTGTLLGDPIEAKALGAVLGVNRAPDEFCALGSVKTNIGHLEAAAGIAGLIKTALALRHRELPPSLNFAQPSPLIPFDDLLLRVQSTLAPWPPGSAPATAGVSSFGFGGTNAHVVLQEAPPSKLQVTNGRAELTLAETPETIAAYLLPLSARSIGALRDLARSWCDLLRGADAEAALHDLCYSASLRRSHHEYRLAVSGSSALQLREGLEAFLREETRPGLAQGHKHSDRRIRLVFVFSGQGSQWVGMGRELLQRNAVFHDAIERCDRALRPYVSWSVLAELGAMTNPARSRLNEVDVLQPALFALQVALAAVWRSWGVEPDAVIGHSMGEVAAAHVAGALSLNDAARIICRRSALVKSAVGRGAMAAVELSLEDSRRALSGYEDRLSIAASNSPTSTILSGDPATLATILDQLRARDVFCSTVKVDFAAHSPQMEPMAAELTQELADLSPHSPSVPIYSTVTGTSSSSARGDRHPLFDAQYWGRNLREPVLFSAALEQLIKDGHELFLELSPHPILLSSTRQGLDHSRHQGAVFPSLRREENDHAVILASVGALYAAGLDPHWRPRYPTGGRYLPLPFYPWQRQRCWLEAPDTPVQEEPLAPPGTGSGVTLGRHFSSADPVDTHFWDVLLNKTEMPHLDEHRVAGSAVLPASFYLEMARETASEVLGTQSLLIEGVMFHRALFLPDGVTQTLQVVLTRDARQTARFRIYARREGAIRPADEAAHSDSSWILHASGRVNAAQASDRGAVAYEAVLDHIRDRCTETFAGEDYYSKLRESGVDYGPYFQKITQLWRHESDILGELCRPATATSNHNSYSLHPAILDACIQTAAAGMPDLVDADGARALMMPTRIEQIRFGAGTGLARWSHAHLQGFEGDSIKSDVRLLDRAGGVIGEISGIRFDRLDATAQAAEENPDDYFYELQWKLSARVKEAAGPKPSAPTDHGDWLIFADSGGIGAALAGLVNASGRRGLLVTRGESFEKLGPHHFCVNPESSPDLRRLFETIAPADRSVRRTIVHLWSLDANAPDETTVASLEHALTLGCASVLRLVQELARTAPDGSPRLCLVTRGAQAAGEVPTPIDVGQAPLWGLGRVIAQEQPLLWGGLLDLESGNAPLNDTARLLWDEISDPDGEDQIALRQGQRYVLRLVRKARAGKTETPVRWRANGSYLITGGLGALGLAMASWMVERGARHLILLGRTALPPRAHWNSLEAQSPHANQIAAIRELEALGASIHQAPLDVADENQLRAFLDNYRAEGWPPICGVIHAAGVLQDGLLEQLDTTALRSVFRPKVTGGWLLHRMLADMPLDFFVLFSSAGAILGQAGQGNYAAANAFLDALAHFRKAQARPALSINWGAWNGLGFAQSTGGKRLAAHLASMGIKTIAPTQALAVLDRLIPQNGAQVIAVPVDWTQYRKILPAGATSRLLFELIPISEQTGSSSPAADQEAGQKRALILATNPADRFELLQAHLSGMVARVLGLPIAQLDLRQPLSNLGLDSLMAVELKNRIAVDLGVNLPMVTFLSGPSVEQAAARILNLLSADAPAAPVRRLAPVPARNDKPSNSGSATEYRLQNLDEYSDEEVNSLLTELLGEEEVSE